MSEDLSRQRDEALAVSAAGAILGMRATLHALFVNGLPTELYEQLQNIDKDLKAAHEQAVALSGVPSLHRIYNPNYASSAAS